MFEPGRTDMSNSEIGLEKKPEKNREAGTEKKSRSVLWKVVGGAAVLAVAAGVYASLNDIRRYIKISTM
jgi:hypothetical protein